jgi:hypothetical protein
MSLLVAVSFSLIGCDTVQTDSPSRANAFPSKSTAYSRTAAPPPPVVSDDPGTNEVQAVVVTIPKKPTPPTPQPAPVVLQQSHPAEAQVVASAAPPVKASEKLMPPKATAPADKSAQKVAPVPSAPAPAPVKTASVAASAPAIEALIVKGPPHPVKQHTQGVGKLVWFGLALFGVAVLLLGTRVSVDNPRPRPAKVSVGRKNKRSKKAAAADDDVVLPPELEMRETTGL